MPKYKYKAITEDGSVVTGETFSASRDELARDLISRGLFVAKISRHQISRPNKSLQLESLLFFLKEFIVLLSSGLPIPDSLEIAAKGRGSQLGGILTQIRYDILGGARLSQAFARLAENADPLLLSVITTGERTGRLVDSLESYASLLERKIELRRKVRHAMLYPAFVLLIVSVILVVIFQYSLPKFVEIYADLDTELPAATALLLSMSRNFSYIAAGFIAVCITAWQSWLRIRRRAWLKSQLDRYSLTLPVIGAIQRSYIIALFGRTLSSLLGTGTPLVEAVRLTSQALPNSHYQHRLTDISQTVAMGESLNSAISGTGLLPSAAEKIIEAGEKSGSLEKQLLELARFYENDIDYKLGMAVSLIEPLLILVTGVLVGGIVLVMYLPIFSLAGAIS